MTELQNDEGGRALSNKQRALEQLCSFTVIKREDSFRPINNTCREPAAKEQLLSYVCTIYLSLFILIEFIFNLLCLFLVGLVVIICRYISPAGLQLLLVRIRRVAHSPDSIVVHGQAVGNASVEGLRRLGGGIHIDEVMTLHVLSGPVDGSIDDAIPNSLGNDEFRRLDRGQTEALGHVLEGNTRVRHVEPTQTGLDDGVGQARDEGEGTVRLESVGKGRNGLVEDSEVAPSDSLGDLHVGVELGAHPLGEEVGAFGDLTHEKLNDDEEALGGNAEAQAGVGR